MVPRVVEALALGLIFCMLGSAQEASILVLPTSLTVGVGSVASFHCSATGRLLNWFVDGRFANSEVIRERDIQDETEEVDGKIVSILTVPATARNNNTMINCSVAGTNGIVDSPTVVLTVQGLLSPPPSLHILYLSDPYHHSLLWNAPFSLNLTNIEPDIILYTICNNLTSHCVSTEERAYTFPNLCDPVMFSITAQNIVGKGNASSITYQPRNHERPTNISSIEEEVMFSSSNEPNITLRFQMDGNCYDLVQVQLVGKFSNQTTVLGPVIPNITDTGSVEVILADNITTNEVYNVTVGDENSSENPEATEETILTTFDVQRESVTCDQGMVKVTCIFARGSMAQGCLVIIVPVGHQSSVVYSERALRQETNAALSQNASHSFNLSLGTYNILILDVEADGFVDKTRRLYNEIISVSPTCVLPSPTTSQLAPSLLVPDPTVQNSPPTATAQVSVITLTVLVPTTLTAILLLVLLTLVLLKFQKKRKSRTWATRIAVHIRNDGDVQENSYGENPSRSDHNLEDTEIVEHMESLPQGAANTDLDNESGIGDESTVGSEHEDIDDTPTSVRRSTATPMYAELNLVSAKVAPPSADEPKIQYSEIIPLPIQHPLPIHEMKGMTAAVTPSTDIEGEEVNLQSLLKYLLNIAPKWQLLGEKLGVSDTLLDEIFTNCKSDQDCLIQMLVFWLRNHDSHPTWREITSALHLMEEHAYAESLEHKGIFPQAVQAKQRKSPQKSVVPDGREISEDEGGSEMMAEPQPFIALAGSEF